MYTTKMIIKTYVVAPSAYQQVAMPQGVAAVAVRRRDREIHLYAVVDPGEPDVVDYPVWRVAEGQAPDAALVQARHLASVDEPEEDADARENHAKIAVFHYFAGGEGPRPRRVASTGLDPWRPVLTEVGRREERVLSKPQNLRLWQGGDFGNKLRAWRTLDEWRAGGFRGRAALRTLAAGGGPCSYDLDPEEVEAAYLRLLDSGTAGHEIMICEMAPAESAVLQGEYRNGACAGDGGEPSWDYFYYSTERRHMRDALAARSSVARGLRSDLLLRLHMSPGSYEDWRELMERYPEHVLEVSVYDHYLGDVPRRNALV